jgi:hypothetical protein
MSAPLKAILILGYTALVFYAFFSFIPDEGFYVEGSLLIDLVRLTIILGPISIYILSKWKSIISLDEDDPPHPSFGQKTVLLIIIQIIPAIFFADLSGYIYSALSLFPDSDSAAHDGGFRFWIYWFFSGYIIYLYYFIRGGWGRLDMKEVTVSKAGTNLNGESIIFQETVGYEPCEITRIFAWLWFFLVTALNVIGGIELIRSIVNNIY